MERLYAAMITKWDVQDTVSNWFGIVLGSQHNECQQLNHRKTKHGPLHDVPDQNYLILPIYRHIWKVWRSQSFRPSLSSYQKSCKDLVKYCRERFVLMLESVRSDFNVRSLRLLTNAASSRIRLHLVVLNIISFDYLPQHKCLHFPPYQLLHVVISQNPRYSRFSPVIWSKLKS